LLQDEEKLQELATGRFTVLKNTYLGGYHLYEKDQLRLETVTIDQLRIAYEMVKKQYPAAAKSLIFYHLNEAVNRRYRLPEIKALGE
jgi:hypothetical protein